MKRSGGGSLERNKSSYTDTSRTNVRLLTAETSRVILTRMSKADRLKEEIGWLKLIFGALLAVDVSLVAWLAQNYATTDRVLVLAGLVATLILTGAVVWVNRLAYRRIEQLEDT
jgi:hypothetical protein